MIHLSINCSSVSLKQFDALLLESISFYVITLGKTRLSEVKVTDTVFPSRKTHYFPPKNVA